MAREEITHGITRASGREVIEMSIPGSVDLVVLARFTAATIGVRADFDLDEIDDLRLAVDELSVSFGPVDLETRLRYEFQRDGDTVHVRCTREPSADDGGAGHSERDIAEWQQARELSAQLLDELVTAHGREIANGRSIAWLMKQRGRAAG
jgi:serine/threonine-protein kinase RsbW